MSFSGNLGIIRELMSIVFFREYPSNSRWALLADMLQHPLKDLLAGQLKS